MKAPSSASAVPWDALASNVERLHLDSAVLRSAASDFGKRSLKQPAAVLVPRRVTDIEQAVHFCQKHSVPIGLRGAGHAASQVALRQDGLIVDMRSLSKVIHVHAEQKWVDLEAGTRWGDLVKETLPHGLWPAISVDWMDLTVGGTISTGGIGAQSFREGLLTNQVEQIEIVTGEGRLTLCSRTSEPALFDAARGGLGLLGPIVRLRLRLAPAPTTLHLYSLYFPSLAEFLSAVDFLRISQWVHSLFGLAIPTTRPPIGIRDTQFETLRNSAASTQTPHWMFRLDVGVFDGQEPALTHFVELHKVVSRVQQLSAEQFLFRTPPLMQDRRLSAPPHPEMITFIPSESAPQILSHSLSAVPPAAMGGGPVLIIPISFSGCTTPMVDLPTSSHGFVFSLLRVGASESMWTDDCDLATEQNLRLFEYAQSLGGVRYPVDALPLPAITPKKRGLLKPLWDRFDPSGLFFPSELSMTR